MSQNSDVESKEEEIEEDESAQVIEEVVKVKVGKKRGRRLTDLDEYIRQS